MSAKRFADPETGGISVDAINERRHHLELLRAALGDGQIQPYFQPICSVDGTITAVEALVRWVHPLRGVLGVVEITETDLLSPGAASLANMQRLRFAGIHVSIDDFGTGYSSMCTPQRPISPPPSWA